MPITEQDIKLLASQRLADTDDGGGRKTGNEIVDGNINNLFNDISRLDRTYGRVSLRKVFASVQTDDTEMYSGAHVVLTNPARDPLVKVCLFTTNNPLDERTAARDRIESYVTQGPRYFGWLWGSQLEGQRSLLLFQPVGSQLPGVGDVLFLIKEEGLAGEVSQYVRITKVEANEQSFSGSGATFTRLIVNLEIGDPLRYTFPGIEITGSDINGTGLYTTVVADAAKYYGVMNPAQAISQQDISINVEDIFTNLVPSAQGESPVLDLSIGEAGPVLGSGQRYFMAAFSADIQVDSQIHLGRGIKPGSLDLGTTYSFTDEGDGVLRYNATQAGTIDYSTGTVTFKSAFGSTNFMPSFITGTEISRITNTFYNAVDINNRGYNFVTILEPLPTPKTLIVDYKSQGKWYRLRDNGKGELLPDIANTGTGLINYATGNVNITCAALPDVDSAIIYSWGNPLEVKSAIGQVAIELAQIRHTVAEAPIKPGSVSITWPSGGGTATATDDGNGNLVGDVEAGSVVDYADGELLWIPTAVPAEGSQYTIDYDKYPHIIQSVNGGESGGILTLTLPDAPVKPGSVTFQLQVTVDGYSHIYRFRDNGGGSISAGGFSVEKSLSNPQWGGSTSVSGLSGTIDYVTGIIQVNIASISGTDTWYRPVYDYKY